LARSSSKSPDFEQALSELEELVTRLERGDLPLEEALKSFERGVALTRACQAALTAAQQKVEILLQRGADAKLEPFTEAEEDTPADDSDPESGAQSGPAPAA
jgi:exodeoxyribonuclease VII small subunit